MSEKLNLHTGSELKIFTDSCFSDYLTEVIFAVEQHYNSPDAYLADSLELVIYIMNNIHQKRSFEADRLVVATLATCLGVSQTEQGYGFEPDDIYVSNAIFRRFRGGVIDIINATNVQSTTYSELIIGEIINELDIALQFDLSSGRVATYERVVQSTISYSQTADNFFRRQEILQDLNYHYENLILTDLE